MTSSETSAVCMSLQHKDCCHTDGSRKLLAELNPKYECFNLFDTFLTCAPLSVELPGDGMERGCVCSVVAALTELLTFNARKNNVLSC